MPKINVECVLVGDMQVNCYLVENMETGELFVVDAGGETDKILAKIGDRKPVAVLLTHGHFDHIGAADAVCGHFGIPLYIHEGDAPKLTDPYANMSQSFGASVVVNTVPTLLQGGECLTLGGMKLEVLHTSGHSMGGCCYLLPDGQGVFCGDTLFADGYGRTDFPDGSFSELRESLRKLFSLTPKMPAYPGHGGMGKAGRDPAPTAQ